MFATLIALLNVLPQDSEALVSYRMSITYVTVHNVDRPPL